jgi:hypothetical protein
MRIVYVLLQVIPCSWQILTVKCLLLFTLVHSDISSLALLPPTLQQSPLLHAID